jgi:hypothetical protein
MPSGASWVCWQSKVSTDVLPDAPLPGQWLRSSTKKPNWWPGADKIAGSDFGRTQCARRASAMDGASQSTTDTRIFSEQISRSNVTQVNPTERIAADSWDGRLPRITVGDPGLGTELGTKKVGNQFDPDLQRCRSPAPYIPGALGPDNTIQFPFLLAKFDKSTNGDTHADHRNRHPAWPSGIDCSRRNTFAQIPGLV